MTGAVFGVARRRAVLCEGIPFSSLLYCGADSRHVLWASLFAGDLRFTVCLPCMNFVAGAALWRCFMRLVFTSKTIIFGCHSHSCAYGILYNSMLPSSRHVAHTHTHTSDQIRSHHNDGWWPCVLIGFLSLKFPPLPACPGTAGTT